MKNGNILFHIGALFITSLVSITAFSDTIKIGFVVGAMPTDENMSYYDKEKLCIANGLSKRLILNSDISFVFKKNNRNVIDADKAAKELIKENVDIVLMPSISRLATPAATVYAKSNIAYITSATANTVIRKSTYSRSIMSASKRQSDILASHFIETYPNKTLFMLNNISDTYSRDMNRNMIEALSSLSSSIRTKEIKFNKSNFSEVTKSIPNNSIVFSPIYTPYISEFYNQLVASGKNVTILGTDAETGRKEFYSAVKSFSKNIKFTFLKNWNNIVKGENKNDFLNIHKKYCENKNPTFSNIITYDLIALVEHSINSIKINNIALNKDNLLKEINNSSFENVLDGISYNFVNGYNQKSLYMYEMKASKPAYIQSLNI